MDSEPGGPRAAAPRPQAVRASLALFSQGPAADPCEPRPPPSPDDKKS